VWKKQKTKTAVKGLRCTNLGKMVVVISLPRYYAI